MPCTESSRLQAAADALRRGGVVAHATEGVWGLACDPFNQSAVAKVLAIKGRDVAKGLIVVAANAAQFDRELAALPAAVARRVRESWPGAVTWLVSNQRFPEWITGGQPTVAIRVPDHAQARALAERFGAPMVSTSANRAGEPPALTACEVQVGLGDEIDYLLAGAVGTHSGPSRLIDATSGEVLR